MLSTDDDAAIVDAVNEAKEVVAETVETYRSLCTATDKSFRELGTARTQAATLGIWYEEPKFIQKLKKERQQKQNTRKVKGRKEAKSQVETSSGGLRAAMEEKRGKEVS